MMPRRVWVAGGVIALFSLGFLLSRPGGEKRPSLTRDMPLAVQELGEHMIEEFTLEGFNGDGQRVWRLEGDLAHVGPEGDVFIERDIVLDIRGKTRIQSDKVLWQGERKRFMTNQPVRVEHQGILIHGRGGLGKVDDEFVQINQDVEMELQRGTVLTCRGPVKIYGQRNAIVYHRDVTVTDPEGRLTADKMDVAFDHDRLKIEEVIAEKNVVIEREGDTTHSEMAIYNAATGSVKIVGRAEIRAQGSHVGSYLEKTGVALP